MVAKIYKTLATILGIALIMIGSGAAYGGKFAHSFVADQLGAQKIEMPQKDALDGQVKGGRIAQEDADALYPFAGEMMTTGPQARAFSDHYIAAHMKASAKAAKIPDEKATFEGIGEIVNEEKAKLGKELKAANPALDDKAVDGAVAKEIANKATTNETAQKIAKLNDLRTSTFLNGNSLRGMLLNAYGWYLVGTIALYAGIALIVLGAVLLIGGIAIKPKKQS
ncbi:hypothetical protein JOD55_000242 [Arcanobacterium pluranimalium]|uniref:hypothetical protein n=1 Tax=Arcanobacterium pluranimalium TaxID=108028 RepID=UPI00195B15EE|nr:hypothetical protein [Arcanobacterium pluranimalium]MBM7824415.1 hypothetical protein [Arcanobacterium pluranimalium]